MRKFKNKNTGDFAFNKYDKFYYDIWINEEKQYPKGAIHKDFIENSSDWQEIIEYPIGTKIRSTSFSCVEFVKTEVGWMYITHSPGDKCNIDENAIGKIYEVIEEEPILFTTEDGVDIRHGDRYWFICSHGIDVVYSKAKSCENYRENRKRFSTAQKAKEYILYNKKCLSINEVCTALYSDDADRTRFILMNYLKNKE